MAELPIPPVRDWDPFKDEDEEPPQGVDADEWIQAQQDQRERMEDIFLRLFGSPEGAEALRYLRRRTEGAPGFTPEFGLLNGVAWGFAREGQNSIIRHIDELRRAATERISR